jgi:hypothetical protein
MYTATVNGTKTRRHSMEIHFPEFVRGAKSPYPIVVANVNT